MAGSTNQPKAPLYPDLSRKANAPSQRNLDTEDVEAVRAAGVSDEALIDAINVCAIFNIIDRIADALDFHIPDQVSFARAARFLLKRGYRI